MIERCKKYTPYDYSEELLNAVKYTDKLYGKTILENSCGIGNILSGIVKRYIVSGLNDGLNLRTIKEGLERDIWGIEIDKESINICKKKLSEITNEYGIEQVTWNIINGNYLRLDIGKHFDYIVGNPPYITYREIPPEERIYIQRKFESCKKWKCDYYYAFVEKSLEDLKPKGKMAYILPDGIYKNIGAKELRKLIKPYVKKIIDYVQDHKFPDAITSSGILVIEKRPSEKMLYVDASSKIKIRIDKKELKEKWIFLPVKDNQYRFGDYYKVINTIATLCNEVYLLSDYKVDDQYFYIGKNKIEKSLVKPVISRKNRGSKDMAIIFPYKQVDGAIQHYTEEEFAGLYPYAYRYLVEEKTRLDMRASDKNAKWFEYGRSQALNHVLSEKLIIPSVGASKISATLVDKNTIPLAGFFITAKTREHTLEEAKRLIEGEEFYSYLRAYGTHTTGKSRRISVKDIMMYSFKEWV